MAIRRIGANEPAKRPGHRGEARGKAQGKAEEAKRLLLLLGEEQFGPPDIATARAVERIRQVDRLEELATSLLRVKSCQELLDLPATPRRRK